MAIETGGEAAMAIETEGAAVSSAKEGAVRGPWEAEILAAVVAMLAALVAMAVARGYWLAAMIAWPRSPAAGAEHHLEERVPGLQARGLLDALVDATACAARCKCRGKLQGAGGCRC